MSVMLAGKAVDACFMIIFCATLPAVASNVCPKVVVFKFWAKTAIFCSVPGDDASLFKACWNKKDKKLILVL